MAEVPTPRPRPDELLVRVRATTVTIEEPRLRGADFQPALRIPMRLYLGVRRPRRRVLGFELAGDVVAIGHRVEGFDIGEKVYGYTGLRFGASAEYACVPADGVIAPMPTSISYEEAATIPNGALTALAYLQKVGRVQPGEHVLVYGASGSVGTAAVQLARHLDASVTGVCSTGNLDLVRSLGATDVLDYTADGFTIAGARYDVIFDTVDQTTASQCLPLLHPGGRYLVTDFGAADIGWMLRTWLFGDKRVIALSSPMYWEAEDLKLLADLVGQGAFRPVVDRVYPLEEIVEAHRYVETGHKKGNVAVTMG